VLPRSARLFFRRDSSHMAKKGLNASADSFLQARDRSTATNPLASRGREDVPSDFGIVQVVALILIALIIKFRLSMAIIRRTPVGSLQTPS
jgi:hypothetical protein